MLTLRVLPVAASLLLHAAVCGTILLTPGWSSVREAIIIAELVPDPEPPAPAVKPAPRTLDSRPLKLPRPIQTPMPKPVEPPVQTPPVAPPPPATVAPPLETPAPASIAATAPGPTPTTQPGAAAGSGPLVPADAPITSDSQGLPTQPGPPAPPRPAAPSIAALPSEGVTQIAAPRGGYQVKPSYPTSARRAGIQGTTLLGVFVAADGRVGEVVVKQSAGHPDLDAAAADAVRRWRFEPARRGSEPVAMWVLLPVQFRLR